MQFLTIEEFIPVMFAPIELEEPLIINPAQSSVRLFAPNVMQALFAVSVILAFNVVEFVIVVPQEKIGALVLEPFSIAPVPDRFSIR